MKIKFFILSMLLMFGAYGSDVQAKVKDVVISVPIKQESPRTLALYEEEEEYDTSITFSIFFVNFAKSAEVQILRDGEVVEEYTVSNVFFGKIVTYTVDGNTGSNCQVVVTYPDGSTFTSTL